jgi:hypothetical protein
MAAYRYASVHAPPVTTQQREPHLPKWTLRLRVRRQAYPVWAKTDCIVFWVGGGVIQIVE